MGSKCSWGKEETRRWWFKLYRKEWEAASNWTGLVCSGFLGHAERQGFWTRGHYHLPTQGNGNPKSKRKKKKRKPVEKLSASLFTILLEIFKIFLFCPILGLGEIWVKSAISNKGLHGIPGWWNTGSTLCYSKIDVRLKWTNKKYQITPSCLLLVSWIWICQLRDNFLTVVSRLNRIFIRFSQVST